MIYHIGITEILHRDFDIEAPDLQTALSKAQERWTHHIIPFGDKDPEKAWITAEDEDGDFREWLYD